MSLRRTQYWNPSTGTVRAGDTAHGESVTDVESYLEPIDRFRTAGLHLWGVADGLRVTATLGATGVKVGPGMAVDASGRTVVLETGGVAVVVPVDPEQVLDVPTVVVGLDGVTVATDGLTGENRDVVLTVTWREAQDNQLAGAPALVHAPWFRLVPDEDFTEDGGQVPLAAVELDEDGTVLGVSPSPRQLAGLHAGRLELRAPRGGEPAAADQRAVAELGARFDGGVVLQLLTAPSATSLSVDGKTGELRLPAGVQLRGAAGGHTYRAWSGPDGRWHLSDLDIVADRDRLVVDAQGFVGIGTGDRPLRRNLQVEGTEIHSGGPVGGYSFADRGQQAFVESPTAGERWVWFADSGKARLWSGGDKLTVTAAGQLGIGVADPGFRLDVSGRIRLRQGGSSSAGLWLFQDGTNADQAFVGMADDSRVGFWGNTANWGLTMNTTSGEVALSGDLTVAKTADGTASFTHRTFANEGNFTPNNLKLEMANRAQLSFGNPLRFEFMVGYSVFRVLPNFGFRTDFVRVFGVDQDGRAFFSGGKGGYVVDYFVNAAGDALEQGDVVVLGAEQPAAHYGSHDDIPVPEVDLTDRPYDHRVCGIVVDVVGGDSLPGVDPRVRDPEDEEGLHPLARFAGAEGAARTEVGDRQLGRMVTLGAWAHCKVDADVAPIGVGDLLTTSATRGHAQKAEDRGAAVGAIVGKAMAPLASGRGVIPVLVGMQ